MLKQAVAALTDAVASASAPPAPPPSTFDPRRRAPLNRKEPFHENRA